MKKLLPSDSFLNEAKKAKFKPNVFLQILIFLAVFIVTQLAVYIPVFIGGVIYGIVNGVSGNTQNAELISPRVFLIITLFSTAAATFLTIIYCKHIEKRSLKSMGFVKKNAVKQYLIGLLIGFVQFSVAVGICVITGTIKYEGVVISGSLVFVILFFFGFLVQGMEEEVLCRGYFMTSLSTRVPVVVAIMISSVAFASLHLGNPGMSILPFINLILFGAFASIYAIRTNNLWGACALHSMWNFTQSNIFGILCSGQDMEASVFQFVTTENGTLINGGAFGIEGGLADTIVEVLAIVITLIVTRKKKEVQEEFIQDEQLSLVE